MSYALIQANLERDAERFRDDVFDYLQKTGRATKGRSYFGKLAANNPSLVKRLEEGQLPSLETMLMVWSYMELNPPKQDDSNA